MGLINTYNKESIMERIKTKPKAERHNEGKVDYTFLPVDALNEEAKGWMAGEKKYGRGNWQKLWAEDTNNVVLASLLRHAFAILEGQDIDPETGVHHAGLIRCNAAMLIRHYNNKQK
jgi:hypothetical protein